MNEGGFVDVSYVFARDACVQVLLLSRKFGLAGLHVSPHCDVLLPVRHDYTRGFVEVNASNDRTSFVVIPFSPKSLIVSSSQARRSPLCGGHAVCFHSLETGTHLSINAKGDVCFREAGSKEGALDGQRWCDMFQLELFQLQHGGNTLPLVPTVRIRHMGTGKYLRYDRESGSVVSTKLYQKDGCEWILDPSCFLHASDRVGSELLPGLIHLMPQDPSVSAVVTPMLN